MRSIVLLLSALLSALWLVVLPAQASVRDFDSIVESGVLRVAVYQDFPPYSFQQDGRPRASTSNWPRHWPRAWASSSN